MNDEEIINGEHEDDLELRSNLQRGKMELPPGFGEFGKDIDLSAIDAGITFGQGYRQALRAVGEKLSDILLSETLTHGEKYIRIVDLTADLQKGQFPGKGE